jgi:hypothetical protein
MGLLKIANKAKTANPIIANVLKRGKTPDQCKCIDFFFAPDVKKKKGCLKPKDWTIDDYCAHVQNKIDELELKLRALEKIGLDESQISEIPPIYLSSFVRGSDLYIKTNEDCSKYVTNKYYVTWIFFSATQLYTYTYVFDTTSDDVVEATKDFFYSDITCIRTEHEVEEAIYEVKKKGCLAFIKSIFGGKNVKYVHNNRHWDTLQITVPNDSYSFCCRTTETLEQSIQAAKAMIREKKKA